jgi:hypothetical protein
MPNINTLIIIKDTNCVETLKYIRKIVRKLAAAGLVTRINYIKVCTPSIVADLQKNGIVTLPALVRHDGKLLIGRGDIISYYHAALNNSPAERPMDQIDDEDMHDWMMRQMYIPDERGFMAPREDDEVDGSERQKDNVHKRMAKFEEKRGLRGQQDTQQRRQADRRGGPRRTTRAEPEYSDEEEEDPPPRRAGRKREQPREDIDEDIEYENGGIDEASIFEEKFKTMALASDD